MILQIPLDAKTYEMQNSIIWFDENNILYSRPKEADYIEQTREDIVSEMEKFREITGNKKVSMIGESHPGSKPTKKADRDFIAAQLNSVIDALAIINSSAVTKMIANIFFSFNPAPYPMKMFKTEAEAKEWIKTCKKNGGENTARFVA